MANRISNNITNISVYDEFADGSRYRIDVLILADTDGLYKKSNDWCNWTM